MIKLTVRSETFNNPGLIFNDDAMKPTSSYGIR